MSSPTPEAPAQLSAWAYFSQVFMGVNVPIGDKQRVRGAFYRGSDLLTPLSDLMYVPLDQINYLACSIVSVACGLWLMRGRFAPLRATPRIRALIEMLLGLLLVTFCFGNQVRVLLLQSTVAYILMLCLPQTQVMAVIVTVWSMFYMTLVHLCRWQYDYGGYTLDISGPVMVQTQRLSSLAFSLVDGALIRRASSKRAPMNTKPESPILAPIPAWAATLTDDKPHTQNTLKTTELMTPIDYAQASMQSLKSMLMRATFMNGVTVQTYLDRLRARLNTSPAGPSQSDSLARMRPGHIEHAVGAVPGPIEFFAYTLYFHGVFVGPFVFYTEYAAYLRGYEERRLPPVHWLRLAGLLCRTTISGLSSAYVAPFFAFDYVLTAGFAMSSTLYQIAYSTVSLVLVRQKYYFAWSLSEMTGISAGLGFTGYCPNSKRPQYTHVRNFDLRNVEMGISLKHVIDSWNISTTRWLREVFYDRLPQSCRTLTVFIISALWHGFYPGYYFMFCTFALFTFISRMWRRRLRDYCRQMVPSVWLYDLFTGLMTNLAINYAQAPFHLLGFSSSLLFWSQFNFFPHCFGVLLLFGRFIQPRIARRVRSRHQDLPAGHGRTVGG